MLRKLLKKLFNFGFVENYQNRYMIVYPKAKINIGLYVTEKRNDGFHNISSVFFPIKLTDILEIKKSSDLEQRNDHISFSGLNIPGNPEHNLISKAVKELRKEFVLPCFNIHLHKRIPMGAGLGGGSADGSYALNALRSFATPIPEKSILEKKALSLGSDCPFFLNPVPSIAMGRGEILKKIKLNLSSYYISIFNPGIHVSTADAYGRVEIKNPEIPLHEAVKQPVESWNNLIFNMFEAPVFDLHPQIGKLKKELFAAGAVYASMTGSGSSVFGLFKQMPKLRGELKRYHIWTELI